MFATHLFSFSYRQKFIWLLCFTLLPLKSISQPSEKELLSAINKQPEKLQDSINYELFKFYRVNDPQKAKSYARHSYQLSQKFGHNSIHVKAGNALAYFLEKDNQIDSALFFYREAIKVASINNYRDRLMYLYNNIGNVFERIDLYDSALSCYTLSHEIAVELGSYKEEAIAKNNIGHVYSYLGNYNMAVASFVEAIDIKTKNGIAEGLNLNRANLASTYNEIGKYHEAIEQLNIVKNNCKEGCDDDTRMELNYGLGFSYLKLKHMEQARSFFMSAFDLSKRTDNKLKLANTFLHIATIEINDGNYTKAVDYLSESETIANALKLRRSQRDIYNQFSVVYAKMGLTEKSQYYHTQYTQMRDSILNKMLVLNAKVIELTSKQKHSEKVIEQKDTELQQSRISMILVGIICVMAFVIIVLVYRSLKSSRNLKRKLENEVIDRTFQFENANREVYRLQVEFNNIIFRTSQYIREPFSTLKGLVNIATKTDTDERMLRECVSKMLPLSKDFDVILDLLKELHNIRDQEITPLKVDVNMLSHELYTTFESQDKFPLVSLVIDKSVSRLLTTDKNLLINLITTAILYFNTDENSEKAIGVSISQDENSTVINIEDNSLHTLSMLQENVFNLFLAQITAFKLRGHILLAERDNRTMLRVIIPNEFTQMSDKLPLKGKHLVMS